MTRGHPTSVLPLLPGLFLIGCVSGVAVDDDSASPIPEDLIFVVTTDYTDTTMGTVDPEGHRVTDGLLTLAAGDVVATVSGGDLYLLARRGLDHVTRYPGSDLSAPPAFQVSTGPNSNPHDLTTCGDRVFVSLYDAGELVILDRSTGGPLGSVDLTAHADSDPNGNPEPGRLLTAEDRVFVALERFIRGSDVWQPSPDGGRVLGIDCLSGSIVAEWTTGPSPSLGRGPDGTLVVRTGTFFQLDGRIEILDPIDGSSRPWATEAELGGDVVGWTLAGEILVVAIYDFTADRHHVQCRSVDGAELLGSYGPLESVISDVAFGPDGAVWLAMRPSWTNPATPGGVLLLDPTTCAARTEPDAWLSWALPPYDLAMPE